jgi:SecD/SecF fusion protein
MKVVMIPARLIMGSLIALALMAGQPLAGQASDSPALGTDRSHVQATQTACAPGTVSASAVSRDLAIVQLRLRALGVTNAQVTKSSGTCVVVSAPLTVKKTGVLIGVLQSGIVAIADGGTRALNNGARVILVCATASCEPGVSKGKTNLNARPPTLRIVVSSRDVRKGSAQFNVDSSGQPAVVYSLKAKGSRAWCSYTTTHVSKYAAIVANDIILSDPVVQDAICGGETQVTGLSTAQAKLIAAYLNYGAMPVPLQIKA